MSWAIAVSNRARKSLKRVPAADQARIMAALSVMQSDPLSGDVVKLASQDAFRRVHIGASCAAIATEYLLHLLIGRQVSSDRTLFDDLPFFIGDVAAPEPLLDLSRETRDLS